MGQSGYMCQRIVDKEEESARRDGEHGTSEGGGGQQAISNKQYKMCGGVGAVVLAQTGVHALCLAQGLAKTAPWPHMLASDTRTRQSPRLTLEYEDTKGGMRLARIENARMRE